MFHRSRILLLCWLLLLSCVASGQASEIERYTFGSGGRQIRVTVSTAWRIRTFDVFWRSGGARHQRLTLPRDWVTTNQDINGGLPGVLLWQPNAATTLLIIVAFDTGYALIHEYRSPIIYRLQGNRWRLCCPRPELHFFSHRGSFYREGRNLYTWDITSNPDDCYNCPLKYVLRHYQWRHGRLVLQEVRTTHRHYEGAIDVGKYEMPARKDPLREFGLRWRWWG